MKHRSQGSLQRLVCFNSEGGLCASFNWVRINLDSTYLNSIITLLILFDIDGVSKRCDQ
ncbi:hypothetical protein HanXRQr2_Chr02g0078511 [Helianthus annuus]|uniref:Uncharacterized protein n=1 Tax=Helianthus annuus TaxID=4232 RepID=A0A9K3JPQ4_HELAN|nr:hypothetical protein HanXRQr2_Chr02g0078511 [Helianthus annuus]